MSMPKFQKNRLWAIYEAAWDGVVVRRSDVEALVQAGGCDGVHGDAAQAYFAREKNRALRDAGWTKEDIALDEVRAELIFLQGLPVLCGEQG